MSQKYCILKPERAQGCVAWLRPHVTRRILNQELAAWHSGSASRIVWKTLIKEDRLDDLTAALTVAQEGKRLTFHQASVQLLHDFINGFSSLSRAIQQEKNNA